MNVRELIEALTAVADQECDVKTIIEGYVYDIVGTQSEAASAEMNHGATFWLDMEEGV